MEEELDLGGGESIKVTDLDKENDVDKTPDKDNPNPDDKENKDNNKDGGAKDNPNKEDKGDEDDDTLSTGELEAGSIIEVDGNEYVVAENGDVVDADGNVIKPASEVKEWLASFEENDNEDNISIDNVIKTIGVEVTNEEGKSVEFTDDLQGIKSYFDSVLEIKSKEYQEAAINKLFNDVPVLAEFLDYLQVNNGDPQGFGEIRDRSGITVDKDSVEQQKAIIKTAAKEFGNSSLSDAYIKYLEETGGLFDEAVAQLQNLQEADKAYKTEIARRAQAAREKDIADKKAYWDRIEKTINSRNIGGYKIPDTFIKDVDGKKMTFTPNDFLAYISQPKYVDENNNSITAYQRDLNAMSEEDLLNAELLDAYLKFTGGSYKDLVEMAVNDKEVKRLRLISKNRKTTPAIRKPNPSSGTKANIEDIAFG